MVETVGMNIYSSSFFSFLSSGIQGIENIHKNKHWNGWIAETNNNEYLLSFVYTIVALPCMDNREDYENNIIIVEISREYRGLFDRYSQLAFCRRDLLGGRLGQL